MKWKKTASIFVMIIFAAILVACETNNPKPEQITTPLEQEITAANPPSEIDIQSGEQRLFPYNGEQLCVFERSTTSDVGLYTKENFSSHLLFEIFPDITMIRVGRADLSQRRIHRKRHR